MKYPLLFNNLCFLCTVVSEVSDGWACSRYWTANNRESWFSNQKARTRKRNCTLHSEQKYLNGINNAEKAKRFYLYFTVLNSSEYECDIFICFSPYSLIKVLITTLPKQSLSHSNCNFTLLEKIWSKKLPCWEEIGTSLLEKNKENSVHFNSDTVCVTIGRWSRAWFFVQLNVRVVMLWMGWRNRHLLALGFSSFICNMQIIIRISVCSIRMEGLTLCISAEFSPTKSLDESLVQQEACSPGLVMPAFEGSVSKFLIIAYWVLFEKVNVELDHLSTNISYHSAYSCQFKFLFISHGKIVSKMSSITWDFIAMIECNLVMCIATWCNTDFFFSSSSSLYKF